MQTLRARFNDAEMLTRTTAKALKDLQDQVFQDLEYTAALSSFMNWVSSECRSTAEKLRRVLIGLRHGYVDLLAIRELSGGWPCHVDGENIIPLEAKASYTYEYAEFSLNFIAERMSPDTKIYRLRGVTHWRNPTGEPTLMQYAGQSYAIFNHKTKCAKAIEVDSERRVATSCSGRNFTDPAIRNWTVTTIAKNPYKHPVPTQHFEVFPSNVVYCFTKKIAVSGTKTECPPFLFLLRCDMAWTTDDYLFTPNIDELTVNTTIVYGKCANQRHE